MFERGRCAQAWWLSLEGDALNSGLSSDHMTMALLLAMLRSP